MHAVSSYIYSYSYNDIELVFIEFLACMQFNQLYNHRIL